jgi:IMP dehydrogenase
MSHKDFSLSLPVFSAPMDSVTGFDMVLAMNEAGGMGVLPRNGIDQSQVFLQLTTGLDFHDFFYSISSSMGIREFDEMEWLKEHGHRLICVEVAHGGNIQAVRKVEALRDMFPEALIMSGNVATFDEFIKLSDAGASFIRVGIGGGSACTTRIETGHGVPTLQSIIDIDKMRKDTDAAIIADGGLRSSGDAAKAFAAGAKFVMLGGMLARTNSAPEIRDSNNNIVFITFNHNFIPRAQFSATSSTKLKLMPWNVSISVSSFNSDSYTIMYSSSERHTVAVSFSLLL